MTGTRLNYLIILIINIRTPVLNLCCFLLSKIILVEVNSEKLHETKAEQIPKMSSTSVKRLHADTKLNEELQVELARMKRNEEVMMKFSKALWSVLKQYKNMLEVKFVTLYIVSFKIEIV